MPSPWQYIPNQTIEDEERDKAATRWQQAQRAQLASEWADRQRAKLQQEMQELSRQTMPVGRARLEEEIGRAGVMTDVPGPLEVYNRPQQALFGAVSEARKPGATLETVGEGARQGITGEREQSGYDFYKGALTGPNLPEQQATVRRGLSDMGAALSGGSQSKQRYEEELRRAGQGVTTAGEGLEHAAGLATDIFTDPMDLALANAGKVGKVGQGVIEGARGLAPVAKAGLRAAEDVITDPRVQGGMRRLVPGATVEDVSGRMPAAKQPWQMTREELEAFSPPSELSDRSRDVSSLATLKAEMGTLADYVNDDWSLNDFLGRGYDRRHDVSRLASLVKRGQPIKVYRATDAEDVIFPGAYVTTSKAYAVDHGGRTIAVTGGKPKILETVAYPDELVAMNPNEFYYVPRDLGQYHKDTVEKALKAGRQVPREIVAEYPDLLAKYSKGLASPPEAGGAVIGAAAGYDPEAAPDENARRMLLGAGAGFALGKGLRPAAEAVLSKGKKGPFTDKIGRLSDSNAADVEVLPTAVSGSRAAQTAPLGPATPDTAIGPPPSKLADPPAPPIKIGNTTIVPPGGDVPPINATLSPTKRAKFSQFWDRARNVIGKQGPAGKQLAGDLQKTRDLAETSAGQWMLAMPTVRRLDKSEMVNMVDVAEGKGTPVSARVAQAAAEWAKVREDIYLTAKGADLDIGRLENYFPHVFADKLFEGSNWDKMINHLVQSGQAQTLEEAAQKLRHVRDVVRNRRHGNLEIEREVDLPDYEKTKDALFGYVSSAADRIAQVRVLGKDDSKAMALVAKISETGYDASAAKNLFDISVGAKKYGEYQKETSRYLRAYSTWTKLGLGALTNLGQSVNTATVTGGLRTLASGRKAISQDARDFALKAGVTLDNVIQDVQEGAGFAGKMGKIGAPGFGKVERFNRTLAAVAGRDYAADMARKAVTGDKGAIQALRTMGLDAQAIAARGGKLNEAEEIQAARNIVERTQFKVDPQDLPGWASSPWGKLVMQFRTFSYNQTAFIGREIVEPALRKENRDVRPLIRFLIYGLPVGAAEVEVQNLLRNRPSEEDPAQRVRQWYQRVGGLGILGDFMAAIAPPNSRYLPGERYALQAASFAAGPTIGTMLEGIGSVPSALQGKPENIERFALKQVPVVGPTIKNTLLPYKPGGRSGDSVPSRLTHPGRAAPSSRSVHPGR